MKQSDAQAYARIRRALWLTELLLSLGFLWMVIAGGLAREARDAALRASAAWPLQVALVAGFFWLAFTLLTFPLDWFRGFRLEHRFGLSTQRPAGWLADHAKQLLLAAGFGLIAVEGLSLFLRLSPERWWAWAAAAGVVWSVLIARLFPTLLIPIFYRQKPLEDARLSRRLQELLERCRTPVRGIFEVNLSRTTKKGNACLCGMGRSRRVLISDTLLTAYPPEEVEVVLAHEVGHHRLRHIGILIGVSSLALLAGCFFVDRLVRISLQPLGLTGLSDPAALPLIALGFLAAELALSPIVHGISRRLEAQADRFALEKTGDRAAFISTMRRLAEQNLAEISPPRWVEWLLYDHPSIARRIQSAEQFEGGRA